MEPEIVEHYAAGAEQERLQSGLGLLERLRTEQLLQRWLPPPPARVLDVGGAAGVYSGWLASLGYEVHLVDPMPLHVEQAMRFAAELEKRFTAAVGDARALEAADASVDAVLMLGPLYHLVARTDRERALAEAWRVLRPGGVLVAAAISRFASWLDGMRSNQLKDPTFRRMARAGLDSGIHRNVERRPDWFTTAYFHLPAELGDEIGRAGFEIGALVAVEGLAWLLIDLDQRLRDPDGRELLLHALEMVESQPPLLGGSAHLLVLGRRK
jgi:ubiquinone/menaquinone biosynthesis C-methylase UbiE